tara:strand:- start:208 stop:396 length:189 start_codon:yes stop_codon:yes gene_type:complete
MTEMERDIYNRAAAHYMKKHDVLRSHMILKEFWDDYFDGNELFEPKFGYVRNRIGISKFPIY